MRFLVMLPCHACSMYASLAISIDYNLHHFIQECSTKNRTIKQSSKSSSYSKKKTPIQREICTGGSAG